MPEVCNDLPGIIVTRVFFVLKNVISAGNRNVTPARINPTLKYLERACSKKDVESGINFCTGEAKLYKNKIFLYSAFALLVPAFAHGYYGYFLNLVNIPSLRMGRLFL